jgi:2-polyprenyl-3-methyl-5-hydroxy-6-metoxy-1,4-benzoquinol methylase
MSKSQSTGERSSGIYAWMSRPWVYDLCQRLIRSESSRSAFFERHIRPERGMRILDVGCGTGDALKHLSNVDYLGIDLNASYIRTARNRWNRHDAFMCGDVACIKQLDIGRFDIVLSLGVLHHLDDATARALLREIKSLLTPQGRFVSHDPVYVAGQSRAARFVVSRDRGRFVRNREVLEQLAKESFPTVKSEIDFCPLYIPYTEIILECSLCV